MQTQYFKEYSGYLNRDMEYKIYGSGKGKICYAFPSQDGRFYDYENFGMVDVLRPFIDGEKITLVCPDSIDPESWTAFYKDCRSRIEMQEKWFNYITRELVPSVNHKTGNKERALVTGCSMGAIHAAIYFFRRPDIFGSLIALSGAYDASHFFGNYMDNLVYDNSPMDFLNNMPSDHPYMKIYNESSIILCIGQGAWEEELLENTRKMDALLKRKGINAWVDYWGYDVSHDWCWWKKQIVYFMGKLFS